MSNIRYAARFEPQPGGGFTITFPDIPEAISEADDMDSAMFNASEVLSLALEQRVADGEPIPVATGFPQGVWIDPSVSVQVALLMRTAREADGKSIALMARALQTSWPTIQRLEKPGSNPTLKQLERAAAALGKRLIVGFA